MGFTLWSDDKLAFVQGQTYYIEQWQLITTTYTIHITIFLPKMQKRHKQIITSRWKKEMSQPIKSKTWTVQVIYKTLLNTPNFSMLLKLLSFYTGLYSFQQFPKYCCKLFLVEITPQPPKILWIEYTPYITIKQGLIIHITHSYTEQRLQYLFLPWQYILLQIWALFINEMSHS